jgi:hypothetical protein
VIGRYPSAILAPNRYLLMRITPIDTWQFEESNDPGSCLHDVPRLLSLTLRPETADASLGHDVESALETLRRRS